MLRRRAGYERKLEAVGSATVRSRRPSTRRDLDDHIGDDLLRLIFTACHPVLTTEAQVALILRLLGGLGTDEIARAFLVAEATVVAAHRRGPSGPSPRRRSSSSCRPGGAAPSGWAPSSAWCT